MSNQNTSRGFHSLNKEHQHEEKPQQRGGSIDTSNNRSQSYDKKSSSERTNSHRSQSEIPLTANQTFSAYLSRNFRNQFNSDQDADSEPSAKSTETLQGNPLIQRAQIIDRLSRIRPQPLIIDSKYYDAQHQTIRTKDLIQTYFQQLVHEDQTLENDILTDIGHLRSITLNFHQHMMTCSFNDDYQFSKKTFQKFIIKPVHLFNYITHQYDPQMSTYLPQQLQKMSPQLFQMEFNDIHNPDVILEQIYNFRLNDDDDEYFSDQFTEDGEYVWASDESIDFMNDSEEDAAGLRGFEARYISNYEKQRGYQNGKRVGQEEEPHDDAINEHLHQQSRFKSLKQRQLEQEKQFNVSIRRNSGAGKDRSMFGSGGGAKKQQNPKQSVSFPEFMVHLETEREQERQIERQTQKKVPSHFEQIMGIKNNESNQRSKEYLKPFEFPFEKQSPANQSQEKPKKKIELTPAFQSKTQCAGILEDLKKKMTQQQQQKSVHNSQIGQQNTSCSQSQSHSQQMNGQYHVNEPQNRAVAPFQNIIQDNYNRIVNRPTSNDGTQLKEQKKPSIFNANSQNNNPTESKSLTSQNGGNSMDDFPSPFTNKNDKNAKPISNNTTVIGSPAQKKPQQRAQQAQTSGNSTPKFGPSQNPSISTNPNSNPQPPIQEIFLQNPITIPNPTPKQQPNPLPVSSQRQNSTQPQSTPSQKNTPISTSTSTPNPTPTSNPFNAFINKNNPNPNPNNSPILNMTNNQQTQNKNNPSPIPTSTSIRQNYHIGNLNNEMNKTQTYNYNYNNGKNNNTIISPPNSNHVFNNQNSILNLNSNHKPPVTPSFNSNNNIPVLNNPLSQVNPPNHNNQTQTGSTITNHPFSRTNVQNSPHNLLPNQTHNNNQTISSSISPSGGGQSFFAQNNQSPSSFGTTTNNNQQLQDIFNRVNQRNNNMSPNIITSSNSANMMMGNTVQNSTVFPINPQQHPQQSSMINNNNFQPSPKMTNSTYIHSSNNNSSTPQQSQKQNSINKFGVIVTNKHPNQLEEKEKNQLQKAMKEYRKSSSLVGAVMKKSEENQQQTLINQKEENQEPTLKDFLENFFKQNLLKIYIGLFGEASIFFSKCKNQDPLSRIFSLWNKQTNSTIYSQPHSKPPLQSQSKSQLPTIINNETYTDYQTLSSRLKTLKSVINDSLFPQKCICDQNHEESPFRKVDNILSDLEQRQNTLENTLSDIIEKLALQHNPQNRSLSPLKKSHSEVEQHLTFISEIIQSDQFQRLQTYTEATYDKAKIPSKTQNIHSTQPNERQLLQIFTNLNMIENQITVMNEQMNLSLSSMTTQKEDNEAIVL